MCLGSFSAILAALPSAFLLLPFWTWGHVDWRGLFHYLFFQGISPVLLIGSNSSAFSFYLYFSYSEFIFFNIKFVYLYSIFGCIGSSLHVGFLSCSKRGYSSLRCMGFSLQWLLLLQSMGSRCAGFSSCGTQTQ